MNDTAILTEIGATLAVPSLPNPTHEEAKDDPTFEAIWNVIKTWDIHVPEYYSGYCGANGSHVKLILDAIKAIEPR